VAVESPEGGCVGIYRRARATQEARARRSKNTQAAEDPAYRQAGCNEQQEIAKKKLPKEVSVFGWLCLQLFDSLLFVLTQKVTKKSRLYRKKRLFYVVMLVRNPSRYRYEGCSLTHFRLEKIRFFL
jgi:hypothetical protein